MVTVPQLARRFGVQDMLNAVKDQPFMASLLYYFGVLTWVGLTPFNECVLKIPNLVAKSLYVERLQESWLPDYEDRIRIQQVQQTFLPEG